MIDDKFIPNLMTFDGDKNKAIGRVMEDSAFGRQIGTVFRGDYRLDLRNGFPKLTKTKEEVAAVGSTLPWPLTERAYSERRYYPPRNLMSDGVTKCFQFNPISRVVMLDINRYEVVFNMDAPA